METAIEYLKDYITLLTADTRPLELKETGQKELAKAIETVLAERERLVRFLNGGLEKLFNDEKVNLYLHYVSKDKIREKLNELEIELKDEKYTHDMYEGTIKYDEYLGLVAKHNILEELLEEE